jgi:hypothetical protein
MQLFYLPPGQVYVHLCTVQIGVRLGTWYLRAQQSLTSEATLNVVVAFSRLVQVGLGEVNTHKADAARHTSFCGFGMSCSRFWYGWKSYASSSAQRYSCRLLTRCSG